MWDAISYLDPLSIHNMRDGIEDFIKNPVNPSYKNILAAYSSNRSAIELSERVK